MGDEPADRLSEVLSSLQDMQDADAVADGVGVGRSRLVFGEQVRVLREVQEQMQLQLRLHDAQIAALREVIALLTARGR